LYEQTFQNLIGYSSFHLGLIASRPTDFEARNLFLLAPRHTFCLVSTRARGSYRQGAVRRSVEAAGLVAAPPQPDHGREPLRSVPDERTVLSPEEGPRKRRQPRGADRGHHAFGFLLGLADCEHRVANRATHFRRSWKVRREQCKNACARRSAARPRPCTPRCGGGGLVLFREAYSQETILRELIGTIVVPDRHHSATSRHGHPAGKISGRPRH
jgi:hypothetical protein